MKRSQQPQITYDTVRRLALALPNVEESTSYGTPALKVRGKLFVCWRIVLKASFDQMQGLMADDPNAYFITDHYLNYSWVRVRLSRFTEDTLRELLHVGYQNTSSSKHGKSKHTKSRQ